MHAEYVIWLVVCKGTAHRFFANVFDAQIFKSECVLLKERKEFEMHAT